MNHLMLSSPFKKGMQIALALLLGVALLGNGVAHASGSCVHPVGAGNCFTSIQAAVDAASDGDRITIRPGKYVEQVTIIGRNLTLVGRSGAVIQAPEAMQDTLSPVAGYEARPIILVAEANVTLRGLVIDGANSGASNPFLYGIFFLNADGVIQDNVVQNIGFGPPTLAYDEAGWPLYQGEAISSVNFGEAARTVTIEDNRVVNYNSSGITIFAETFPDAPTPANLTVHVVGNTVIGSGPNDVLGQWGVFFGAYNFAEITGTLKDNRIQDLVTIDQYPSPGVGIATKDTANVEISANVIENVNMGLSVSGLNTQVLKNRFRKADTGILLFVEFPDYGSAIGTVLEDNRFENVYMDIMTGPAMMFEAAAARTMSEPVQPKRLPR
ncbi:MAG: hypothetical protein WCC12_07570 [Anaerolineales bacterium]